MRKKEIEAILEHCPDAVFSTTRGTVQIEELFTDNKGTTRAKVNFIHYLGEQSDGRDRVHIAKGYSHLTLTQIDCVDSENVEQFCERGEAALQQSKARYARDVDNRNRLAAIAPELSKMLAAIGAPESCMMFGTMQIKLNADAAERLAALMQKAVAQ